MGRYEIVKLPEARGAFKTPALRAVARRPPYMHDGSLLTLGAVVAFYNRGGVPNRALSPLVRPLALDDGEQAGPDGRDRPVAGPAPRPAAGSLMVGDLIRTLYRYNAWANGRVLDTAARLTAEQLVAGGGASFDSIRDTLVHAMSAQWMYLERWQGRSPRAALDPREFPDLASIREWWDGLERRTEAFVSGLDDARLAGVVEYVNPAGERWAYPLWQQMVHQVNHATQHRSEAAVMLTQLGHSPGWLDFLYFIDLQGGGRP